MGPVKGTVEYRSRRNLLSCVLAFSSARICRESPLTGSMIYATGALSRSGKPPDSNHGGTRYKVRGQRFQTGENPFEVRLRGAYCVTDVPAPRAKRRGDCVAGSPVQ